MVMKNFKTVHNYVLTNEWVAVSVLTLCQDDLRCWEEYPTHSGKIEVNSFSAWPVEQIVHDKEVRITLVRIIIDKKMYK